MKTEITTIVINTAEPERLTAFWAGLLGVSVKKSSGNFTWLQPAGESGISIAFQKISDWQPHSTFVHVDILVEDKDTATERIKELGGSFVSDQGMNNIVADPDGNQFCVYMDRD